MALVLGSADLSDERFLSAASSGDLEASQFRHADHLRLAWLYVHQTSLERAEALVRSTIRTFAARHGAADRYNETVTLAWVRLIALHDEASFADFLTANEDRLTRELLYRFWTPELLSCDAAKRQWVGPDREPLPAAGSHPRR